jgi:chitin disaccharide deacetylase
MIRLLTRVDDAGSSWASNIGCYLAATQGIARSVEVMMPCAWVAHAAELFNAAPQIDIGLHLTLASEWDAVKWRPLTAAPSLTGVDGNFLPLLIPREGDTRPALHNAAWQLEEIAAELRAQIALGVATFRQASHVSGHMIRQMADFAPEVGEIVAALCAEFGLLPPEVASSLPFFAPYPAHPRDGAARAAMMIERLRGLGPGSYLTLDHPATASAELSATGHAGYEDVAADRVGCLAAWTDPALRAEIDRLGIDLIGYRDL